MSWSRWIDLNPNEVSDETPATRGVYCIARRNDPLQYPNVPSLTVYIGMAPDRQRGLRAVLRELAGGSDRTIQEGKGHGGLRFCFQGNLGDGVEQLHARLLADFALVHGEQPCCNGRL